MRSFLGPIAVFAAVALVADTVSAQALNNQWVTFSKQNSQLTVGALPDVGHPNMSDSDTQVQFEEGDLNKDGWLDVVCMRKQSASMPGKRTNVLLMNVNGVLTNQTALYATASNAPGGDQGFLTPVNTRESVLADLNNDGWLDVVTATTISDGDPKYISHPRIYMNLGKDGGGNWLGLFHDETRFPQLNTIAAPHPVAPRFCGMAVADVDEDGYKDLYFVDYDTTETGIVEAGGDDLNDRLLLNSGGTPGTAGFFTDTLQSRMTSTQLLSAFGADAQAVDINVDGHIDLVKDTTLGGVRKVAAYYNNPAAVGNFSAMGEQVLDTSAAPYAMEIGNLNNDAFVDITIVDDGQDYFRLGAGFGGPPLFYNSWSAQKNFSYIAGASSDDGFGHTTHIRDLDMNGWDDVVVTDVDGDIPGCGRRLHIYHNTGSVPGQTNLVLREESELGTGNNGAGWKGVKGMLVADLKGSYDLRVNDLDNDGDNDMLVGICAGTNFWRNETNPVFCQTDLGFQGPGSATMSICGGAPMAKGFKATLSITGGPPSAAVYLFVALSSTPTPFKGGTLVPASYLLLLPFALNGSGDLTIPNIPGGGGPVSVYLQAVIADGAQVAGFAITNAVRLDLLANP